jgi:uncharacterized protein (TIGR02217 family)
MRNFLEIRLPENISLAAEGGAQYSTDVVTSATGYEYRNVNWINSRAKYNLAPAICSEDELSELISFFRICKGKAIGFRFKDFSDFRVNDQLIANGDGLTKTFQLMKSYQLGALEEIRNISKPVEGKISIKIDGKSVDFKCDFTTGKIDFEHAPYIGAGIYADFEFDVPVRFDTDHLSSSLQAYVEQNIKDIPIVELRF